jgi:hypothetical protein
MKLHKLKAGEATGTYLVDVRTRDHIVIGNEDCAPMPLTFQPGFPASPSTRSSARPMQCQPA